MHFKNDNIIYINIKSVISQRKYCRSILHELAGLKKYTVADLEMVIKTKLKFTPIYSDMHNLQYNLSNSWSMSSKNITR